MKKNGLILVCVLLALLCACSSAPASESLPSSAVAPQSVQSAGEPDVQEPADSGEEGPGQEPEADPVAESGEGADLKSVAEGLIGEDISVLYDAIGYPESSDYAPSCLGDGEDGNLYYGGFTVYTYREGDSETVYYVE